MNNDRPAAHTFLSMAVLTLISKFFGFFREMVIANYYGTSYIVDSYVMASAIPGILFGGVFGAIATAYIPTFSRIKELEGEGNANKFTSQILNLLILLSLFVSVVGILLSNQIVSIFASGFEGETANLTSFYIKITFSYVLFTSITGILDAYMQYRGSFLKPIISGYFQNAGIIFVIVISAFTSHYYLAFGMLFGVILRFLYIGYNSRKAGFFYIGTFSLADPVRKMMVMALPVFIGSYISQINAFVDKTLASRLPEGSVSALNYGMILINLITGLTVTLLVTMIYPKIARSSTMEDWDGFNRVIQKGANYILLVTIPFSLGIMLFSHEFVQIVYERGAFDPEATALTSGAFLFYGIGLVFMSMNGLLTKIYYSMGNTRTPILCSVVAVFLNIVLNLLLIDAMAHRGLALATSLASLANSAMLYTLLGGKYKDIRVLESKEKLLKILTASILSVGLAFGLYEFLLATIWMPRILYLFIVVVSAAGIYGGLIVAFRIEEVRIVTNLFR
jgi:putative peptidoglycan lipid II flippase